MSKRFEFSIKQIPKATMIVNSIMISYVFGRAFLVSMFEPGKHYTTKTSILLIVVILIGLVGLHYAANLYPSFDKLPRRKLITSIALNLTFVLIAFLMLLLGALIV